MLKLSYLLKTDGSFGEVGPDRLSYGHALRFCFRTAVQKVSPHTNSFHLSSLLFSRRIECFFVLPDKVSRDCFPRRVFRIKIKADLHCVRRGRQLITIQLMIILLVQVLIMIVKCLLHRIATLFEGAACE